MRISKVKSERRFDQVHFQNFFHFSSHHPFNKIPEKAAFIPLYKPQSNCAAPPPHVAVHCCSALAYKKKGFLETVICGNRIYRNNNNGKIKYKVKLKILINSYDPITL